MKLIHSFVCVLLAAISVNAATIGIGTGSGSTTSIGEPWKTSSTRITRANSTAPLGVSEAVYPLSGSQPVPESAETVRTSRDTRKDAAENKNSGSEQVAGSSIAVFVAGLFGVLVL